MARHLEGDFCSDDQAGESYHVKVLRAFVCPLTKQIMQYPVTIENGHTFEKQAIVKWFRECNNNGGKPVCPLTMQELHSTNLIPNIALRNAIEEWTQRKEVAKLDRASTMLTSRSSESDALGALCYIMHICQKNKENKQVVRNAGVIRKIADILKGSHRRRVLFKALQALQILIEENDENKEVLAAADITDVIIKFLLHEDVQVRELAVSLLYELSKSDLFCEKIGDICGAILLLEGMACSASENTLTVDTAEKILKNLEKCDKNIKQMAENGRLQPLLTQILDGSPKRQLSMVAYLDELVLSNNLKVLVTETVGSSLVTLIKSESLQAKEAALKALNQISSNYASASILIEAGILPPLVKDLFVVGIHHLPERSKEVAASVLANIVACKADFLTIPLDNDHKTLVSEEIVHNILQLISSTGPTISCNLLCVLVELTSSSIAILNIVSAIKSSGGIISLLQFTEAHQKNIRIASLKLLQNISPYMGHELADALRGSPGHLGSLVRIISKNNGITEEQASAITLLANLPERELSITKQLLELGVFDVVNSKVLSIQQGKIHSNSTSILF